MAESRLRALGTCLPTGRTAPTHGFSAANCVYA